MHSKLENFHPLLMQPLAAPQLGHDLSRQAVQSLLDDRRANITFDLAWMEDVLLERMLADVNVKHVAPLLLCVTGGRVAGADAGRCECQGCSTVAAVRERSGCADQHSPLPPALLECVFLTCPRGAAVGGGARGAATVHDLP